MLSSYAAKQSAFTCRESAVEMAALVSDVDLHFKRFKLMLLIIEQPQRSLPMCGAPGVWGRILLCKAQTEDIILWRGFCARRCPSTFLNVAVQGATCTALLQACIVRTSIVTSVRRHLDYLRLTRVAARLAVL